MAAAAPSQHDPLHHTTARLTPRRQLMAQSPRRPISDAAATPELSQMPARERPREPRSHHAVGAPTAPPRPSPARRPHWPPQPTPSSPREGEKGLAASSAWALHGDAVRRRRGGRGRGERPEVGVARVPIPSPTEATREGERFRESRHFFHLHHIFLVLGKVSISCTVSSDCADVLKRRRLFLLVLELHLAAPIFFYLSTSKSHLYFSHTHARKLYTHAKEEQKQLCCETPVAPTSATFSSFLIVLNQTDYSA
jgi:hypothetical protein